jgi:hypothetical protein
VMFDRARGCAREFRGESVPRLIGFVFKAHAGGHTGTDCTGYNG